MDYKRLLNKVEDYALNYFKSHKNPKLQYHSLKHTLAVVKHAIQIANHYQITERDFFIVITSAWFHDTGYFEDINNHEERSSMLADEFLNTLNVEQELIEQIRQVILSTKMTAEPKNQLENILCDADLFHLGTKKFRKKAKLMHKEIEFLYSNNISKKEWLQKDVKFLQDHHFHTDFCALLLNDDKMKNLEQLKKKLEKGKGIVEEPTLITQNNGILPGKREKLLNKKDKQRPDKGIETMFRITSTNNQRLSDMADNKAQLLITVNSIILSLIVSLVLKKLEDNTFMIIPTFILLVISLTCIVFSILATRPSIPDGVFTVSDINSKKVNLLFFGNFYKMTLTDYSKGMIKVMNDQEFLYGTLITDVYSQGVVLGRKYKLIRIAYNVFMFGLIAAVLAYVIAYIAYGKLA